MSCDRGKYKPASGSATCSLCPAGTNSAQSSSTSATACICNTGYISSSGAGGETCSECVAGKFKLTASACQECPAHTSSPVVSSTSSVCVCNAGSYGLAGGPCTVCIAGTYRVCNFCCYCRDHLLIVRCWQIYNQRFDVIIFVSHLSHQQDLHHNRCYSVYMLY